MATLESHHNIHFLHQTQVKRLSWEIAGLEVWRTKQHLVVGAQVISNISIEG